MSERICFALQITNASNEKGMQINRDLKMIHIGHNADAELRRLNAKISELEKDARRLDFVIDRQLFIVVDHGNPEWMRYQLLNQDEDEEFHVVSGEGKWFNNWRDAIDAAIDSNVPGNK